MRSAPTKDPSATPPRPDGPAPTGQSWKPAAAVQVVAADADNPVPPTIEIAVGGVRVAELQGPTASLEIDTASLAKGPVEIRAIARDNVGNLSKPAVVMVNVE